MIQLPTSLSRPCNPDSLKCYKLQSNIPMYQTINMNWKPDTFLSWILSYALHRGWNSLIEKYKGMANTKQSFKPKEMYAHKRVDFYGQKCWIIIP